MVYKTELLKREIRKKMKPKKGLAIKAERILAFLIFLVWTILLWAVAVIKINSDGIVRFLSHFTNWAWIVQIILFTMDLISRFEKKKKLSFFIVLVVYWIVNAITWMVFWLVWIALDSNPGLLENETKEHGGKFNTGFVFNMHALFHVIPSIMMLLYTVFRRYELRFAVAFATDTRYVDRWVCGVLSTLITFIDPILISAVYVFTTNIVQVYQLKVGLWVPLLVALGVLLVHNVVAFIIFYLQVNEKRHKYMKYPILM